jgi:tetratricopeptide (TPR) repeat protein
MDSDQEDAHAALCMVMLYDWDWAGAESECRRAVALNPNSIEALRACCWCLTALGKTDEAAEAARKALEIDPLSRSTNLHVGWVLYYDRQFAESIAQFRQALDLFPNDGWARVQLAWSLAQLGRYDEACASCDSALVAMPDDQLVVGSAGMVYGYAGRRQTALALRDRLTSGAARGPLDSYNVVLVCDGLGDTDGAIQWLERAYKEHSPSIFTVRCEITSARLRTDKRFLDVLHRMRFPGF